LTRAAVEMRRCMHIGASQVNLLLGVFAFDVWRCLRRRRYRLTLGCSRFVVARLRAAFTVSGNWRIDVGACLRNEVDAKSNVLARVGLESKLQMQFGKNRLYLNSSCSPIRTKLSDRCEIHSQGVAGAGQSLRIGHTTTRSSDLNDNMVYNGRPFRSE
jgi:hypothetical protein